MLKFSTIFGIFGALCADVRNYPLLSMMLWQRATCFPPQTSTMPSESRRPYVALTPNQTDFPLQPLADDSTAPTSITTFLPDPSIVSNSRWHSVLHSLQEFLSLNAGLLLVTAAQAVFSLVNVAVKILQNLDEPVSTLELIVVRMAITYICSVGYMLIQKIPHPFIGPEGVRVLLVFRGVTGFIGLNGTYFSLQYLSLSDVTVLSFLVPMCTAILGSIFLKETFTKREALAGREFSSLHKLHVLTVQQCAAYSAWSSLLDLTFYSGLRIAHQPSRRNTECLRLVSLSRGSWVLLALVMTTIRAIGQRAHPMHLLASFSIQSVIVASIIMAILREPFVVPTRLAWLGLLAVIGILGFGAQVLLTMGFQRETAGRASMAMYTQIIFASVLERIFFHTTPTLLSLLGTSIIMSSALYVALTKKKNAEAGKPEQVDGINRPDDVSLEEGLLENFKAEGDMQDESPQ
ncbi:Aldo-keto reductase [Mycena venus]|uniref:Aldo-keto reductase n=1 Tax=Mycena venus TaxID=2733690 RepID=A0A8H6WUQ1_9AGAR|nr:Aldo-keto reductase [Mycena venus]